MQHDIEIPERITFHLDERVRAGLADVLASYGAGPVPSLSAVVREAMLRGLPLVTTPKGRARRARQ